MWYLAIFMTPHLKQQKGNNGLGAGLGGGGSQTFLSYIWGGGGREFFSKGIWGSSDFLPTT